MLFGCEVEVPLTGMGVHHLESNGFDIGMMVGIQIVIKVFYELISALRAVSFFIESKLKTSPWIWHLGES